MSLTITHIGGPTALLKLGGLALLTDPTFDEPREYKLAGLTMRKLTGPALRPAQLGGIDAVLLSHDQHLDNLDLAGRALLPAAKLVLSTTAAASRLDRVTGLAAWRAHEIPRPDGGVLTVTGVPARHGPEGCEPLLGEVTGFVLAGDGLPTVYVSGDNASVEHVAQIAGRVGTIDVALLFAGAARSPALPDAALTLTAADAVAVARLLDPAVIVPVHAEGWAHFSEGPEALEAGFAAAGMTDRLRALEPGRPATLG